jgi:acetyl esterase
LLTRFNYSRRYVDDYIANMAIDPELLPFLGGPDTSDLNDIAGSRAVANALTQDILATRPAPPAGVMFADDIAVDASGNSVSIRIYRRHDLPPVSGALLFLHGGAFVFGDLELEHDRCVHYAATTDCVIVAVDYRLAPEFPYPAALDDAALALNWLITHSGELGVDSMRICIGGASAGGSLAAGLVLRNRDEGGPEVAAQMLIYPVLDDRGTSLSMSQFEIYDPWDGDRSRKMWPHYLGNGVQATPYSSPARATNLAGLPPTFILSCEEDPLRDEDLDFAQRLLAQGVGVELHHYRRTYHAFDVIAPETAVARRALNEQSEFLRSVLAPKI